MTREQLAAKLKARDVKQPYVVIDEARRADILVASALAMLENETGIPQKNIFGQDHGLVGDRVPFDNRFEVTKPRCGLLVAELRRLGVRARMNGVGWTQLTWFELVLEAEREGGAHIPRYQCRVGFRQLRRLFDQHGSLREMFRAYNGTGADAYAYADRALARRRSWLATTGE